MATTLSSTSVCSLLPLHSVPRGSLLTSGSVDIGDSNYVETLATKLTGEIAILSKHKFSSNVVEKVSPTLPMRVPRDSARLTLGRLSGARTQTRAAN